MPLTDTTNASNTRTGLEKNTLVELKGLCKIANVPITGSKQKLIGFLLNPKSNQKGRRKARTTGPEAAKVMIGPWSILTGMDEADQILVDPTVTEESLRDYVHSLAESVDADWYGSYDQNGDDLRGYMDEIIERAQACLRIISKGAGYDSAFRTICTIADTWDDINCIPFRPCPSDHLGEVSYDSIKVTGTVEFSVECPQEFVNKVLPIVLTKAASDPAVTDSVLERMIKDAKDHHVESPHVTDILDDNAIENDEDDGLNQLVWVVDGSIRLESLYNSRKWKLHPSWKPKHKMRRRLERPQYFRTRFTYDDYDDY